MEISREKEKSLESEKHEKEKTISDLENQIKEKNNEIEEIRSQQIKVSTSNEERNIENLGDMHRHFPDIPAEQYACPAQGRNSLL